ncbi:MAG: hypothetical protein K0S30_1709 [Clostridia bacterium]|jgi:hypothetical protein|nr:hypothetical protein [Clostridia bacterium]
MDIAKKLREYKYKKSLVDTTLARIEQYKYAIAHPELRENYFSISNREIGMPGAPLRSTASPIEKIVVENELTEEILNEWIREDRSRIFIIKLEIDQIDIALEGSLTKQERAIIKWKYFDNMFWKDIEINYNNEFRQKNYVSQERLKQNNKDSLKTLEYILAPFYKQQFMG